MKQLRFLVLRNVEKLFQVEANVLESVRLGILPDSILRNLDALQAPVPVIQLDRIAKEGDESVSVAGADTPYQVQEQRLIEVDDSLLKFGSDPSGRLNTNSILPKQEDRELTVPLHSRD